jgi:hypothetical protein
MKRYNQGTEKYKDPYMVEDNDGEYAKWEDVVALLKKISDNDTDMSPRQAVIKEIIDNAFEENE